MTTEKEHVPHIVIVGAGLSGITAAIQLKRQLGFQNFTIYERSDSIGGTWRDNSYPGCGSDVPAPWYSLSTDPNPNWSSPYCGQPELRAYWETLWRKYDLPSHTKFGFEVLGSKWHSDLQQHTVFIRNVNTGEQEVGFAEVVFYAVGPFQKPFVPGELQGIEDFRGISWHSARWRHDVDLKNKTVGVVGSACSAAQIIPVIAADPTCQVINFCRTPNWFVPRFNLRYPSWVKWVFANVPIVMLAQRWFIMAVLDISSLLFRRENKAIISLFRKALSSYIRAKAPKNLADKLIPEYTPGCKRLIKDPGYLDALHQPNVTVEWNNIDKIVEDGVVLKNGDKVMLDTIVFATGFTVQTLDLAIEGRDDRTLQGYYEEKGGETAYLGTMAPGFPNMFTLIGPNVSTGYSSMVFTAETQVNYAIQMFKHILSGQVKSFEVKADVTDKYNDWVQGRLSGSVYIDCNSWYQASRTKNGKISTVFPGPISLFWWFIRKPKWEDYVYVSDRGWARNRGSDKVKSIKLLFLAMVVATAIWRYDFLNSLLRTPFDLGFV